MLPRPGDSKGTFWSSSQAATCPPVYPTLWRLHNVLVIAERQARKLWIPIFVVFCSTRPGIEPESTVSVADALSTQPVIGGIAKGRCRNSGSWLPTYKQVIRCFVFHRQEGTSEGTTSNRTKRDDAKIVLEKVIPFYFKWNITMVLANCEKIIEFFEKNAKLWQIPVVIDTLCNYCMQFLWCSWNLKLEPLPFVLFQIAGAM